MKNRKKIEYEKQLSKDLENALFEIDEALKGSNESTVLLGDVRFSREEILEVKEIMLDVKNGNLKIDPNTIPFKFESNNANCRRVTNGLRNIQNFF